MDSTSMAIAIAGGVLGVSLVLAIVWSSVVIVKEREVMIIERIGRFHTMLTAGVHFIFPFMDTPKKYNFRYWTAQNAGDGSLSVQLVEGKNLNRIFAQDIILDFPRQHVITKDNASVLIDAVLSFKVVNPRQMIYSCVNLQQILCKLLQAQLRSIAAQMDVDELVEDTSIVNAIASSLDSEATRWGVKIRFVKIQKIETPGLEEVLARQKRAAMQNKESVMQARAVKQTSVIEAEGIRDSMIREAEGEAQESLSRAEGKAQAMINAATAEARSIKEIARAVAKTGENPSKYLLAVKYIDAMQRIVRSGETELRGLPPRTAGVQSAQALGFNTLLSHNAGGK